MTHFLEENVLPSEDTSQDIIDYPYSDNFFTSEDLSQDIIEYPYSDNFTSDDSSIEDHESSDFSIPCNSTPTPLLIIPSRLNLQDQSICFKTLDSSLSLTAELTNGEVKIFIGEFIKDLDLLPFPMGINLDLTTWYRFMQKLKDFNPDSYPSSFIANNQLLVLNQESSTIFRHMISLESVELSRIQLSTLKDFIPDFNDTLLFFLCETFLPALMSSNLSISIQC